MSKQSIVRLAIGLTTLISALVSWYCLADILNNSVRDAWIARVLEISLGFIVLETLIGLFFLLEERWSVLLGGQLLALAPFFIFFPDCFLDRTHNFTF